jgi:hypothetical protein
MKTSVEKKFKNNECLAIHSRDRVLVASLMGMTTDGGIHTRHDFGGKQFH